LFSFVVLCFCVQAQIDPRGARPVEHGTRADKCATQREWPFCTSDEWGPKCPSGCRIQGLMDKYDHGVLKGIEKIRKLLDQNSNKHRSLPTSNVPFFLSGSSNNYQNLAQSLRQKITDMKIKIDRQMRILGSHQSVNALLCLLQVDIDIKLRSCKGSCSKYSEHQVDQEIQILRLVVFSGICALLFKQISVLSTPYILKTSSL
uniref:Fibrinogen alpha/beta/gamma chain coiled coil domain-containing protein n=1 Tax=Gouania willdenowi TaxID=441366 RepID=A0A8C5ESG9_GOUWI